MAVAIVLIVLSFKSGLSPFEREPHATVASNSPGRVLDTVVAELPGAAQHDRSNTGDPLCMVGCSGSSATIVLPDDATQAQFLASLRKVGFAVRCDTTSTGTISYYARGEALELMATADMNTEPRLIRVSIQVLNLPERSPAPPDSCNLSE